MYITKWWSAPFLLARSLQCLKHLPHYQEGHFLQRIAEFWLPLQDSVYWTMVLTQGGQGCHSVETLLMRSESEKTNSKAQREKDVFSSAGQNTTFLAGTSRTVCPLWQIPYAPGRTQVCFYMQPSLITQSPSKRICQERYRRDFRNWEQSAACCFTHTISRTIWSSWLLGKQPKKIALTVDGVPSLPFQRCCEVAGSASVASLHLPTHIKQLNSWVHDQNTEPVPSP